MVLDIDDAPDQDEVREVLQSETEQLERWRYRTFYCLVAWLLSCAFTYLFFAGHLLHAYWKPFGIIAYYFAFGVLLAFIYCAIMWCTTWSFIRNLKRTYLEPLN